MGAVTGGIDTWSTSLMKNVYGAVRGALVKGGLSAAGGGISGGFGNVIMEGNWGAFGNGFGKGVLVGGVLGGISGGREGFLNAKNSVFERNLVFGNLSKTGREEAFKSFVLKHELYQNGMMNYSFEKLDNSYGVTKAISPETGETISIAKSARQYPNGVNSEYTFTSKKLVSIKKIEANVIHEKQHILDLHSGQVSKILQKASSTEGFRAMLEIRAHRSALKWGFQRSCNLGRIKYWDKFLK